MASLIDRYVDDLLDYALINNVLEEYYRNALVFTGKVEAPDNAKIPQELDSFLKMLEQIGRAHV